MRILDREFFRIWWKPTLASFAICLMLFLLVDVLGLTEDFLERPPSLSLLSTYVFYRSLYFGFFLIPLSCLLGSFWGFCTFRSSNEWTATLTSGMHPAVLVRVPLVGLVVLTVTMVLIGSLALPWVTKRANFMREQGIKGNQPRNVAFSNLHFLLWDRRTIDVRQFKEESRELVEVVISRQRNNRLLQRVYAQKGVYQGDQRWALREVVEYQFQPSGELKNTIRKNQIIIRLESPGVLKTVWSMNPRRAEVEPAELSMDQLWKMIGFRQRRSLNASPEWVYLHWKLGFALSVLVLGLIGLILGTQGQMNRPAGVGFCIVFGFVYWTAFSFSISLGKSTVIPAIPDWAAAMGFVYGPPVLFLMVSSGYWILLRD